jgi:hypothetical protein
LQLYANADATLKALEARAEEVHVLLTDVHMLDFMHGMELGEQVHACWPHVLLLISSGYARPHPDEIPDHGRFIPKLYGAATLVRQIYERLHRVER